MGLGIPLGIRLVEDRKEPLFHPGGAGPIFLAWDPGQPRPRLELTDLRGRKVPIAVKLSGRVLALMPERRLPIGVYMARIP